MPRSLGAAPLLLALLVGCDSGRSIPPGPDAGGGDASSAPAPEAGPRWPVDPDGEWKGPQLEPPDTVVVAGDSAYYLDRIGALSVVDLSQPERPVLLSRSTVGGSGVALFHRGRNLFAVLDDQRAHSACAECPAGVRVEQGAEVAAIDVSDPRRPAVLSRVLVAGRVLGARLEEEAIHLVTVVDGDDRYVGVTPPTPGARAFIVDASLASALKVKASVNLPRFSGTSVSAEMAPGRAFIVGPVDGRDPPCTATVVELPPRASLPCARLFHVDFKAAPLVAVAAADLPTMARLQWRDGTLRAALFLDEEQLEIHTFAIDPTSPSGRLHPLGKGRFQVPDRREDALHLDGERAFLVPERSGRALRLLDLRDPNRPRLAGRTENVHLPANVQPVIRGPHFVAFRHAGMPVTGTPQTVGVVSIDVVDVDRPRVAATLPVAAGVVALGMADLRATLALPDPRGTLLVPFDVMELVGQTWQWTRARVQALHLGVDGTLLDAGLAEVSFGRERLAASGTRALAFSDARMQVLSVEGGRLAAQGAATLSIDVRRHAATADGAVVVTADRRTRVTTLHAVDGPDRIGPPVTLSEIPDHVMSAKGFAHVFFRKALEIVELGTMPRRRGRVSVDENLMTTRAVHLAAELLVVPRARDRDCEQRPKSSECSGWDHDLAVFTVADPDAPRLLWSAPLADPGRLVTDQRVLAVDGATVTLGLRRWPTDPPDPSHGWQDALVTVDLGDPTRPVVGQPMDVPGLHHGDIDGVSWAVDELGVRRSRLISFRIAGDRAEPLGSLALDEDAPFVMVGPQAAYLTEGIKLVSIDLRDPAQPKRASAFDLPGAGYRGDKQPVPETTFAYRVVGQTLLVQTGQRMLAFDVRDPVLPRWRGTFRFQGNAGAEPLQLSADGTRGVLAGGRHPIVTFDRASP